MIRPILVALTLALAVAASAAAQDRPSEEELFGPPSQEAPKAPVTPDESRTPAPARPEEAELFGGQGSPNAAPPPPAGVVSRERDDALRVGGQIYLRAATSALRGQGLADWPLFSPNLLDVYLDVRPNDRVRGFVLGRMFYDPTLAPPDQPTVPTSIEAAAASARPAPGANPSGVLDQLWVNFDVERQAFVTVGRQHAKWGVGRFWNPTDYLHPVRRNPLAVFDERTGTTMVKVHVPWEARGWNLYGVALAEDVAGDLPRRPGGAPDATNRLGRVGAGGRAEIVLGPMELGADAVVQSGHRPRFGVDVSTGVWDLDVYAEAALRTSVDTPRWRVVSHPPGLLVVERDHRLGFTPQVVAGATWAVKYSDEDAVTFGAEYFYDRSGYESAEIYPALLGIGATSSVPAFTFDPGTGATTIANPVAGQPNPFTPFYLGRHYAGAFVSLPAPGRWNDTTLTLSLLGNLSDRSFIARLDHSVLVLTYLRVETFVAGRFGSRDGEYRLGSDGTFVTVPGAQGALPFPPSQPLILDAGVAVRVSL
jgi:hypothetical protein